jgi:TatD DNase family protein
MIDSHCHLADDAFVADLDDVVARAKAAGVARALCILAADEAPELERASRVKAAWPAVEFAASIHPHRAGAYAGDASEAAARTRAAVDANSALVIGEIGLDYHYDFAPRDVQRDVFAAQIALALELDRPVAIHTREAMADTMAVLRQAGAGRLRGVMHCFSGTQDEARQALDIGFYISIAGIVTFNKADALREMARLIPDDRLLVETDAPFLAPVPYRGKRNEPAFVAATVARLAAVRGTPADVLAQQVAENFAALTRTGI